MRVDMRRSVLIWILAAVQVYHGLPQLQTNISGPVSGTTPPATVLPAAPLTALTTPLATSLPTSQPTLLPTSLPTALSSALPTALPTAPPTALPNALPTSFSNSLQRAIKVGVLIPANLSSLEELVGYERSIGALNVAARYIAQNGVIPQFNFTFDVQDDKCSESEATGRAVDMIEENQIDLLIGPTCSDPANRVASVTKFFNVPLMTWGMTSSRLLANNTKFSTLVSVTGTTLSLSYAFLSVVEYFEWDRFAMIYSSDIQQRCSDLQSDFEVIVSTSIVDMSYVRQIDPGALTMSTIQQALRAASNYARIIALCFEDDDAKRTFFLAADALNMTNSDFVFVLLEFRGLGFNRPISMNSSDWSVTGDSSNATLIDSLTAVPEGFLKVGLVPIWVDQAVPSDGLDNVAKNAMKRAFVLDLNTQSVANLTRFNQDMFESVDDPPFNCVECKDVGVMSVFAKELADALILYAAGLNITMARNRTNPTSGDLRLGKEIAKNLIGYTFNGYSGNVTIDKNGVRVSNLQFSGFDSNFTRVVYFNCTSNSTTSLLQPLFSNEATSIWANRDGARPLSVPKCGFDGSQCQPSFWDSYGAIIYAAAGVLFLLIALTVGFLVRGRYLEYKRLNAAWIISHFDLRVPQKARALSLFLISFQSSSDMQSMRSVNTNHTTISKTETDNFAFYQLNDELVAVRKFKSKPPLKSRDLVEFRFMRQIENDNLAKFLGFSTSGTQYLSVWRYYMRGSIEDIIAKGSYAIDAAFMTSLIRDIANASMLYMAPEILRRQGHPLSTPSTKEADVYSFGIVCAEVINRKPAWESNTNDSTDTDELIYLVKRQRETPVRPVIDVSLITDLNTGIPHLIRDCWSENPNQRPSVTQIRSLIRNMGGRNESLMDHVFRILEHYTTTLQEEVEERTRELLEEKKRSDVLLYRLLPRQIADKLKTGSVIEPESFDSVTIFFSDVVRFSELSRQSTALQAITLLNDLFTMFDGIIEIYDAYKVESVGDDTLVASGLPRRNGIQHAKEIANMSLAFMDGVENFRIPHLPMERVELRIGFHSGPCVAGVVGLAMPRYCLFGDTVNTASRMCSNSKPGRIHLSSDANNLLQMIKGFNTISRGELIIKGKGVMETFFLGE
ncbi:Guanylate cyclase [Aphelenchoides fujianensis]|nr:Guanylate cyclase [Aphelenchoides fujianensis]